MAEMHLTSQLSLPPALTCSCVVKMWGFQRKKQRQGCEGHPGRKMLQMVQATDQRAKRDDVVSYVSIQTVVTSVQIVQQCIAWHMAVARDVNIPMVVARVQFDQRYFAQYMGVASDVNIRKVVGRVLRDQHCFA
jgi:hypothetical protein